MLDYYAGVIGLEKQTVYKKGEGPPWSPKLKGNRQK
jgi:hypothetical protein